MNKFLVAALILLLSCQVLLAQCPTERYYSPTFTSTRTMENVNYNSSPSLLVPCIGQNIAPNLDYDVDVYMPDGDTLSKRPVIVYAHGGAFAIGWKRIVPVEDYCYQMANRGYVVVSLDYRKCS